MTAKVLVVDDDADLRFTLTLALELAGYEVRSAASGEDALAIVDEDEPDAIVLDIRMPDIDGWEVLRRLDEAGRLPRIPVVVVSALTDLTATAAKAAGLGCRDYLAKPVTAADLMMTLEQILGGASSTQ